MTLNDLMHLHQRDRVAYIGPGGAWSGRVYLGRPNYHPFAERTSNGLRFNMVTNPEDWERIDEGSRST